MRKLKKILLVLDSWMLRHDAGPLLDTLGVEGTDVIFYYVVDYSEAIATSPDQYNETILPGSGILSANQFIAARKRMVDSFLSDFNRGSTPINVEVEIHPQPAGKILEKAELEGVDLLVLGVPHSDPERIDKITLVQKVIQESNCFVLTVPTKEIPHTTPSSNETQTGTHASQLSAQGLRLSELRPDVYLTADYTPSTREHCRHPLDLHAGRHCSVCEIFRGAPIGHRCPCVPASYKNSEAG